MKLELKHLAPYLPYGLKGLYNLNDVINTNNNEVREKILTEDNVKFFRLYCKPILRPLSDLENINLKWREISLENIACDNDEYYIIKDNSRNSGLSHYFFMWLIENHFDVFVLIEQGLAIDINTI